MSDSLHERALKTVNDRYDRCVMNNTQRGDYIECLVAELLGPDWVLPWKTGYDWAPWDLEHRSTKIKIEIRQAAARQSWHTCEDFEAKPPKFDIAPRKGYFTQDNVWHPEPGRYAHIYIFAWHPKTKKGLTDHRSPEQWEFYVLPTKRLPPCQRNMALSRIKSLNARPARSDSLARAVEELHETMRPMRQQHGKRMGW